MAYPGSMLAATYDQYPGGMCLIEPKLDGYRLTAYISPRGQVTLHCGEAEEPGWAENLVHIRVAIEALVDDLPHQDCGMLIDGELMAADWNSTSSLVRRKRSNMSPGMLERLRAELKYHLFDLVSLRNIHDVLLPKRRKKTAVASDSLLMRRKALRELLERAAARGVDHCLRPVPYSFVRSASEADAQYARFVEEGYEGAMLKPLDGLYALGDRVPYWLKLKPFESVEMTVVGSIEGLGQHVGRLGALTCRSAAGVEVSVGGGFTHEERDSLWAVRDALPGRIVEVKVQAGSVATARHPVFLRFRTEREKTEAGPKKTLQTSKT